MKGIGRLSQWIRPAASVRVRAPLATDGGADVILQTRSTARLPTADARRITNQALVLDQAIDLMTANQQRATEDLEVSIARFRIAFERPSWRGKTLDRAWNVHQAWRKLRTIEGSLHMLSKERARLAPMLDGTPAENDDARGGAGFPPPPHRPAPAAVVA